MLGLGPHFIKKRIYRAAVSQRLRNTDLPFLCPTKTLLFSVLSLGNETEQQILAYLQQEILSPQKIALNDFTGMRRITTFGSTTERICDGGPITL